MKALSVDNYIINHFAPSLEDLDFQEDKKNNLLQKHQIRMSAKKIKKAIYDLSIRFQTLHLQY